MENLKVKALSEVLEVAEDTIEVNSYNESEFTSTEAPGEYVVLTEDEREQAVTDNIAESLWAFRSEFLADMTGLPVEMFKALADKCEDANDPIYRVIEKTCGLDKFVETAVEYDGYGHFLSSYDGDEKEANIDGERFYIYRTN